jgi:hypothetical protein
MRSILCVSKHYIRLKHACVWLSTVDESPYTEGWAQVNHVDIVLKGIFACTDTHRGTWDVDDCVNM